MRRRDFIGALTAVLTLSSPAVGHAQGSRRMRRIGVLMPYAENDLSAAARIGALKSSLRDFGWIEGRNIQMDCRYAPKLEDMKQAASDLVREVPDAVITTTNLVTITVEHETHTIPVIFVGGGDMIKEGLVKSLAQPGGNVTGFTNFEPSMGGKWLQLLKDIAPRLERIGFLHNPKTLANVNDMRAAEAAAQSLRVGVFPIEVASADQIDAGLSAFSTQPNVGVIVAPNPVTIGNHDLIVRLMALRRMPAIYPLDFYSTTGGLASYGPDQIDMFRRSAQYIDRILKGESPANLPVQTPNRFQLIINKKTANALGLPIPASVLARADEVIE